MHVIGNTLYFFYKNHAYVRTFFFASTFQVIQIFSSLDMPPTVEAHIYLKIKNTIVISFHFQAHTQFTRS